MPNKHALIIGVDRYPALDAQYQLSGCVNDAVLMRQLLTERFGFNEALITSLHNEAASREAILAAMQQLLDRVQPDDVVHVHFSGHGSRRTSAAAEQGTGKDSTIMPSDSGRRPLPNLDIVDHEINAWLQKLSAKTRSISLLFDCCHSGTLTRDPFAAKVRAVPDDTRSLAEMGVEVSSPSPAPVRAAGETGWLALSDDYVVLSGCRDNELAHEFSDQRGGEPIRNGALSHFLTTAMLAARPGYTYRDVFESAFAQVNSRFPTQHPQIEGAQDRELFGGREITALRFVSLIAAEGEYVTLGGGAAHGLQPGARWAAYPPATKSIEGLAPLATLEIERVDTLSARARVIEPGVQPMLGARCVELQPSTAQFRLGIDLSALSTQAAGLLSAAIEASSLLRRADQAEGAEFRVYCLQPGDALAPGASSPLIEPVSEPCWLLVDRSGRRVMPTLACATADAVERLIGNAETLARYRNALALDNPDSALRLRFQLYREDTNGEWRPCAAEGERLREGESIAFEFINEEPRPVFLSVLDFGVSGRVQLLYPPNRSSELVEAGQALKIGFGRRRIRLALPEGFSESYGSETFKALVTLDETDFSWLQQAGTRSAELGRSRLKRLFEAAYRGPPTRDAAFDACEEDGADWRAINRSFELARA
jgi:hypothetical protein